MIRFIPLVESVVATLLLREPMDGESQKAVDAVAWFSTLWHVMWFRTLKGEGKEKTSRKKRFVEDRLADVGAGRLAAVSDRCGYCVQPLTPA